MGKSIYTSRRKDTLAKFVVKTRKEAVQKFEEWILYGDGKYLLDDIHELKDKRLGCWCKPKSCHGDVLSRIANQLNHTQNQFFEKINQTSILDAKVFSSKKIGKEDIQHRVSKEEYLKTIGQIKSHISKGDIYEISTARIDDCCFFFCFR